MLNEALHTGLIKSVDGYQDGKPEEVLRQAFAVWKVLQDRGIRYSDVSTTPGERRQGHEPVRAFRGRVAPQPAGQLRGRQRALCLGAAQDGARAVSGGRAAPHVRRRGAEPAATTTTRWPASRRPCSGPANWTIRSRPRPRSRELERSLDNSARATRRGARSRRPCRTRRRRTPRDKAKFEDDSNSDYQVIDVANARADGIMPIPFDRPDNPPDLPGGPTHTDTTGPDSSTKPLPTPFVKPSPADTPAPTPRSTPRPAATPEDRHGQPLAAPTPRPAPHAGASSPAAPGGGSACRRGERHPRLDHPVPRQTQTAPDPAPTPDPDPTPHAGQGRLRRVLRAKRGGGIGGRIVVERSRQTAAGRCRQSLR